MLGDNTLTYVDGAAMPWIAPGPSELPDLRVRMRDFIGSPPGEGLLAYLIISSGRNRVLAILPGSSQLSIRASDPRPMAALEARRLKTAQLYWVDADMTSLALAAAASPSGELVKARRMPAESGLMVFAEPIGSYVNNIGAGVATFQSFLGGEITSPLADSATLISHPIVAVSWSWWSPLDARLTDQPKTTWAVRTADGYERVPPDFAGIWLTFYTTGGLGWDVLPADTPVNYLGSTVITAGDLVRIGALGPSTPPLQWAAELLLEIGKPLPPPQPDTPEQWAHATYTAWQLMSQTGNAQLTEVEDAVRSRHGRKRDQRAGITGDGTVRLVRVHTRHRPSAQASEEDAAASDGRRASQWTCRWPARPYRRNTCLNPHAHADGGCEHEERVVPGHIKGPADKPLKVSTRVHVWDIPPPGAEAGQA